MRERIGLFGGTFDPIHLGHIKAAEDVLAAFSLNRILFIPSNIPPHKASAGVASPAHRLKMVELACRSNPRFIPSPLEVNAGEKSYSIITLNKVKRLYPRAHLFFILGIDAFLEIETWRDYQRLLRECLFIVMARPGYSLADARGVLEGRIAPRIHEVKDGEKVGGGPFGGRRIFLLPIKALDVSSTEVRRRIKAGESLKGLVSETVAIYLKKHKLYE